MTDIATTVGELRAGDHIRFPDGRGGHVWVSVSRAIPDGPLVEMLLSVGGGANYKTCAAARPVVRRSRVGEAS